MIKRLRSIYSASDLWLWIIAASAALFLLSFSYPYVGLFGDDAAYILAAKSLLMNHYVALYYPDHPALTFYPPGYPLFLTFWVHWVEPHWNLLKWTSFGLMLLNIGLAWQLYARWLEPRHRVLSLMLFAFNPVTADFARFVMSEPLFMTSVLVACLLFMRLVSTPDQSIVPWVLAGVLAYAALIRLTGLLLIPAVFFGLLYARRTRAALQVALTAGGLSSLFFIRNYFLSHHVASAYSAGWASALAEVSHPLHFLDNWSRTTHIFFAYMLLACRFPRTSWGIVLSTALALGVILVIGYGFYAFKQRPLPQRAFTLCVGFFALSWYAVHSLWTAIGARYALPLLPLLAPMVVVGWDLWTKNRPRAKNLLTPLVGLGLLLSYGTAQAKLKTFWQAKMQQPDQRAPQATFAWMHDHLAPTSYILHPARAAGFLYTERYLGGLLFAETADEFRFKVLSQGITHIWVRPYKMQASGENTDRMWQLNQIWTLQSPDAFKPIYRFPEEASIIFEVVPDPVFLQVYATKARALEKRPPP